jgi:hypothetical protein
VTSLNALALGVLAGWLCSPTSSRDGRCTCVELYPPPGPAQFKLGVQDNIDRAVAVFLGEVVTREQLVVVLSVEKIWKGAIGKTVRMQVATPRSDGLIEWDTCDYGFGPDKKHLVFAESTPDGAMKARMCRLTAPMPQAAKTVRVLDDLVKSRRPK